MSRDVLACVAAVSLLLPPARAGAKSETESGADQTQSLESPLPLVGGATLSITKERNAVSLGLFSQRRLLLANYWQLGLEGVSSEAGETTVFTQGEGFGAGLKLKLGAGYSSFQAEAMSGQARDAQIDLFLGEAWCLEILAAAVRAMPPALVAGIPETATATGCVPVLDAVRAALLQWADADQQPSVARTNVQTALDLLSTAAVARFSEDAEAETCKRLRSIEWATKFCGGSGPTETEQRKQFPALYQALLTVPERGAIVRVSANWTPTIAGLDYRPVTNGVADLSDVRTWTGFLNGGSLDASLAYRSFVAGLQVAYARRLDDDSTMTVSACRRTSQADYYFDQCQDSAIGEPKPFSSLAVRTLVALDPLVPALAGSGFRPGAQLVFTWERLLAGKRRYVVNVPVYLARTKSPFDIVVGVKPSYSWTRGSLRSDDFGVSLFVGARP